MSILISNSRNFSIFYFELRLFVIHNEQSDPTVRNVCVVDALPGGIMSRTKSYCLERVGREFKVSYNKSNYYE